MNKAEEGITLGSNLKVVESDGCCTVYKMENDSGEGFMTLIDLLPGIDLMYSDFHMQGCFSEFDAKLDFLAVDYCREGRVEWELSNGIFMYMKDGDIQISAKKDHTRAFGFPLGHYHGVTVAVYIDEASKALSSLAGGFSLNLRALREKFCSSGKPALIKATDPIRRIFAEFYNAPPKIRMDYFKLKALELLLLLDAEDDAVKNETTAYFPKKQVEAVKAIKKHLTENIDKHFTLEELSVKFGIPLTPLKRCFKSVYGTSVYAFVRSYRIHAAAALLRENGESVIAAAGKVGYVNPSKFANAFKEIMGISPTEYKKKTMSEWSISGPNGADDAGSFWYNKFKKTPEGIFLNSKVRHL